MSMEQKVFDRCVAAPVPLFLNILMTRAGIVKAINGYVAHCQSDADELRVHRALYLVGPLVQSLQHRGDLVEDALSELPDEADFDIERSILTVVAQLQGSVLSAFTETRKGAA